MDGIATILIIDDNPANIFALEKLLERPGRAFINATNGKDGLKIALNNEIDLVVLDVQMPEMDGFEVAKILKSNKKTKDVPIMFASAEKKERHFIMKGFEEGAIDYLSKPLDPEVTRAKVSVLLKIQLQKKELIEKNHSLEQADNQIKHLNSVLQKNLVQLEMANKELESFSYSVSHDLRAPLRSVIGYAQILKEDYNTALDDEGMRLTNIIIDNGKRMGQLIDDLLDFSRLGRIKISPGTVNMHELVRSVLNELIPQENGRMVNINLLDLKPAKVDGNLFRQVWTNLVSNALKYSQKKETTEIEIGCYAEKKAFCYYVKDNGSGFDMQYVTKLFGVFQRLHKMDEFEGTGVGLALVKRIVTRHGGSVWAEGKLGEGATFYFTLPTDK